MMLCFTTSSAMVAIAFLTVIRQRCMVVPVSQTVGVVAIISVFDSAIRRRCTVRLLQYLYLCFLGGHTRANVKSTDIDNRNRIDYFLCKPPLVSLKYI